MYPARLYLTTLPLAIFYLLILLRLFLRIIERRYITEHRSSLPRLTSLFGVGRDSAIISAALDLANLFLQISRRESQSLLSLIGNVPPPQSVTILLPSILLLFHVQIYLFIWILNKRAESSGLEGPYRTDFLPTFLGMIALFTNSLTVSAYLGSFW